MFVVILSQYTANTTPSLLLLFLPSIIAGFPISHFAQQQGIGFPGIHHPDVGRCQCTKDVRVLIPCTSQTQIIGDKTRKLQTLQEIPNFQQNFPRQNKNPLDSQDLLQFATKKSPEVSRLKVFTLAPAPVRKRRSSLAPGILEGGLSKS